MFSGICFQFPPKYTQTLWGGRGGVEEFGVRKKRGRRRNLKTQKKIDDYSWEYRAILLLSISIIISFWGGVTLKESMSRFEDYWLNSKNIYTKVQWKNYQPVCQVQSRLQFWQLCHIVGVSATVSKYRSNKAVKMAIHTIHVSLIVGVLLCYSFCQNTCAKPFKVLRA